MTFYVSCLHNTLSSCLKKKMQNIGNRLKSISKPKTHFVFLTLIKDTHIHFEILCSQQDNFLQHKTLVKNPFRDTIDIYNN